MTSMTGNGKVITMTYDAFGNRVAKTVNGVTTQYLVEDDVNPTGLPQVLEEVQNGAAVRTYTYGLQRISQSLSPIVTGSNAWTTSFYGYDGGGSVRQLTNSAGVVTDEYLYDAFGNSFTKTGTTPNNYLYRGEQYDSDLGLYYLRARYYNPNTGRFMSRDPEKGIPTDPKTLHKYLYASGDPINRIDPTGRMDGTTAGRMPGAGSEYAMLVLNVSLASTASLAALSCAINIQYAMDALKVAGYVDVMPWGFCSAKGKRVTCRWNVNVHPNGTPNHASIGPYVGYATGRGCAEACSIARADAYAQAAAASPFGYHIIHENRYCSE